MSRRSATHPMTRLAIAFGAAATNINSSTYRTMVSREVSAIPVSRAELGGGKRGEMARSGRALAKQLPALLPDELADAAERLRAYAGAVGSRFEVTSEVSIYDKRRRA